VSLTTASPLSQTGLIPCIYRRADFPHRATPVSLPRGRISQTRGGNQQRNHHYVLHMILLVKAQ
jgi:hypothetical protein